jgi:hypothetical protein
VALLEGILLHLAFQHDDGVVLKFVLEFGPGPGEKVTPISPR